MLLVPTLSHSLLSVSRASENGKATCFGKSGCKSINKDGKVIAFAIRVGNLYCSEVCSSLDADLEDNKVWDGGTPKLSQVRSVGRKTYVF